MEYGKVVRCDPDRGFWFITPDRGGPDVFLHVSALERGTDPRSIRVGTAVSYDEVDGGKGPKAAHVKVIPQSEEERWPEYAPPPPVDAAGRLPETEMVTEQDIADAWAAASQVGYDCLVAKLRAMGLVA